MSSWQEVCMYACVLFEKSERSGDTGLISGVHPTKSPAGMKTFK